MSVYLLNSDSNEVEVDSPTSSVVALGATSSVGSHHHHHVGGGGGGSSSLSTASQLLTQFWSKSTEEIKSIDQMEVKVQALPLARIKKIMKLDEDVKMISAEAPVLFAKAAELFIEELTLRAWIHTEDNKRRTLQRNDIAMAITKYDQFDFLIDIVPREEIKAVPPGQAGGVGGGNSTNNSQIVGGGGKSSGLTILSGDDPSSTPPPHPPQQTHHQHHPAATGTPTVLATGTGRGTATVNADQVHYYFQLAQQHQAALASGQNQGSGLSPPGGGGGGGGANPNNNQNVVVLDTNSNLRHQHGNHQSSSSSRMGLVAAEEKPPVNTPTGGGKTPQTQAVAGSNNNSTSSGSGGGIQIVQQIVTPSGDVQHIPIQLTPSQMAMIKMQLQNYSGQPIIIQTAPIQAQPQIIQVSAQGSPTAFIQGGSNSGSSSSPAIVANESD